MISRWAWIDEPIAYTGVELRSHYLLETFGKKIDLRGSAVVAFAGPCEVRTDHLVDLEDRMKGDFIRAKSMLHFVGEWFGMDLREGVLLQRLFVAKVAELLKLERHGNDLYSGVGADRKKLSVSIVTASPVSVLFHLGINIDPAGAPVPAVGLIEWGVDPTEFARTCLDAFSRECEGVAWACAKVRPVM